MAKPDKQVVIRSNENHAKQSDRYPLKDSDRNEIDRMLQEQYYRSNYCAAADRAWEKVKQEK